VSYNITARVNGLGEDKLVALADSYPDALTAAQNVVSAHHSRPLTQDEYVLKVTVRDDSGAAVGSVVDMVRGSWDMGLI